jgi:predicted transcriptional regulator
LIKPILLSALIHAFVFLLLSHYSLKTTAPSEISVNFVSPPAQISEPQPGEQTPEQVALTPRPDTRDRVEIPKVDEPDVETLVIEERIDSSTVDSSEEFSTQGFFTDSPFMTYKVPLDSMSADSADSARAAHQQPSLPFFSFDTTRPGGMPGPYDPVRQGIEKYNRDGGQTLPLGQTLIEGAQYLSDLFQKKKAQKPFHFDFIPSKTEIEVFTVLWENTQAKDHDIYTAIDTSIRITAVDLNKILTRLTDKGILKRKIVSPQRELAFPLGKVEMSAKNRRNRVYEYETKIKPQELLVFMQAKLYEIENRKFASGVNRERFLSGLREKIFKVAEQTAKH